MVWRLVNELWRHSRAGECLSRQEWQERQHWQEQHDRIGIDSQFRDQHIRRSLEYVNGGMVIIRRGSGEHMIIDFV